MMANMRVIQSSPFKGNCRARAQRIGARARNRIAATMKDCLFDHDGGLNRETNVELKSSLARLVAMLTQTTVQFVRISETLDE